MCFTCTLPDEPFFVSLQTFNFSLYYTSLRLSFSLLIEERWKGEWNTGDNGDKREEGEKK